MKKSELIRIIKEETDSTIKEFLGMFGSNKEEPQNLTKQMFVNQFNKKAKEVKLFQFPGRDDMPLEMQDFHVSDELINSIKQWKQLRVSKQGKSRSTIELSSDIAGILATSMAKNKSTNLESSLASITTIVASKVKSLEKLPERLIVTGDTAKVKFTLAGRGIPSFRLRKKQALIQTYKKQLEKEQGGQWKFTGTKDGFAVFNKQQSVATTP